MKLTYKTIIELIPTIPFDFDTTFHKPDHFASDDHYWQPGTRWQTWRHDDICFGLRFQNAGSIEKPKLSVTIFAEQPITGGQIQCLATEIRYRYNLDLQLAPFYSQFCNDPLLGPIIRRWQGMRPGHANSLYEYLMIGIVLQNTTVRRSITMLRALLENYGTLLEFDHKILWCFWRPGRLAASIEEELRALKLGYRAKSIKRLDDYFADGSIDEVLLRTAGREAQTKALLAIYGVGPATVWYLLFDVFHQYDFFNHISPWEQKIYSKLFFDRDPSDPVPVEHLIQTFERFGGYRQLAVHYIWEDLWWKRKHEPVPWLEALIRV